ncbi:MAG TPA: acyloxyacyl hydrolase [Idiomarina abyssalis]|uniref:acyloxyacyl hydrolase n=1 Tax=Idiomarina TaxID=135575 RepID=UPI000C0A00B5|nr:MULTISPECIES: acyloxyacyl hydrolase [Idiomarina]MAB21897.1 acyloxyacyl hydrolase [Idiomarina sp.]MAL84353.1 acyloxyacyl hydrolase [Idiomarina sp.]MBH95340.1 acyloxyacyl hydrolase [Idiomarina sp.]QZN89831.1 acyloxyacyl hydrolase [Idiomarina abyssalis]HAS16156.1 acyloxyacyl hydrolase [Idiomarina abyssalis]|tara:strand:- start:675 stop:1193 length:519 start_codon:yes stop_codon:yes gene_type:complete
MWRIASLVVLIILNFPSFADEVHFTGAYSTDQLRGVRAGYRVTNLPVELPTWIGSPKLHVEAALNHWQDSNNTEDNITAFTISPILSWHIAGAQRPLFLEAGIGGSYFDKTQISNRRLSTQFQFEDRISLSWQYNRSSSARIALGYTHYSNADIKRPNDGLDFFWLSWALPF